MDPVSFCFNFGHKKEVPFMFGFALLNCLSENFDTELEQILKEFSEKGASTIVDIQSDRKNFTGKPIEGRTRRNGLDTDPNSPVLDCFQFKKRIFYLVLKRP